MIIGFKPHWISIVGFALWAAVGGFLVMQVFIWWLDRAPFDTPSRSVLDGPERISRAGVLRVMRDVCVRVSDFPIVRHADWLRDDGVLYRAVPVPALTSGPPGCRTVRVAYPVPDDLPDGYYTVHTFWRVQLNLLRGVTIDGGTVHVEVGP